MQLASLLRRLPNTAVLLRKLRRTAPPSRIRREQEAMKMFEVDAFLRRVARDI